jgi:UDP:flavonoid glycosyltransferase YjiC (YdhE family)
MRALFTVQPAIGHLHPLLPVARALEDAGHAVAFCSSASFRQEVEIFGFDCFDAGVDWVAADRSTWTAFPPMPPPHDPAFPDFVVTLFADITTRVMVQGLLALARRWQPDLIVREVMEWSGCIVGELLDIPHASVGGNAYSGVDSPAIGYFPGNRRFAAAPYARHRAEFGLSPDPEMRDPFRHLHLCFMPRRWDRPDLPAPANTDYVRHASVARPDQTLPDWVGDLAGRPTVYAALGTIAHAMPGIFEMILTALRGEDVNLILAVGRDPAEFGPQPPNVRVERHAAQTRLLPYCDAFISHGGFNSVKESLSCGVPLLVLPIMSDEPYSAERCVALGVGRAIGPSERTAASVREAVRDVLANAGFRARAQAFSAEMHALPGPERVVDLLTGLAAGRMPASANPQPEQLDMADRSHGHPHTRRA